MNSNYHKEYYQKNKEYIREKNIINKEKNKKYREKNKEKKKEYDKIYNEQNIEKKKIYYKKYNEQNKEKKKKYREQNKEKILEYKKNYRRKNKEKIKKWYQDFYDNNEEKIREYRKVYYRKNKDRINHIIGWRSLLRNTLIRMGTQKEGKTIDILGYSALDLKNNISDKFTPEMTWKNYGKWHIDHILPVSSFDKNTPPSIVCSLDNLQPLWSTTREINGVIYEGNLNKYTK